MKTICITSRPNLGELDKHIELKDLPVPEPGKCDIRMKVITSAIKIDDIHLAEGTMFGGLALGPKPSPSKPYIPGIDVAGIVDAVGLGVESLKVGQEVYGICNPMQGHGPWAELSFVTVLATQEHVPTLRDGQSADAGVMYFKNDRKGDGKCKH